MSATDPQFTITLSLQEVEALIRRVVKDAIHEEFIQLQQYLPGSIAENWAHEGEEDLAGDQLLLAEALAERERYRTNPEEFEDWTAIKAKLEADEAAGELPD